MKKPSLEEMLKHYNPLILAAIVDPDAELIFKKKEGKVIIKTPVRADGGTDYVNKYLNIKDG